MIGPNLSEWALNKRSLVVFLMILAVVAGVMSFFKLGRGEDPAITTRTMVVAAGWPGATVDETMKQVTERLERTLQETDYLDRLRSYTIAGQTTIFVNLKQSTPPHKIPDIWYQVRKNIGDMRHTLPQGVLGPFLNDDFGDTFGIIYGFTADGFGFRELRDHVEAARSRLLQLPDVSKIEVHGRAGRADLHRVLHRAAGRPAPEPEPDRRHAAGAEPGAPGRHDPGRAGARVPARVRRLRLRARHRGGEHRRRRAHLPPGRHRHRAPRLHRPAAADVPRQRQAGHRPGDRHARRRRHPGARRERAQGDGRDQGQPAGRHRAGAGGRPGGHGRPSRSATS